MISKDCLQNGVCSLINKEKNNECKPFIQHIYQDIRRTYSSTWLIF